MATKLSFEEWKKHHPGINVNNPSVSIFLEETYKLPAEAAAEKVLRERYEEYVKDQQ
jgi:hypothetical protein